MVLDPFMSGFFQFVPLASFRARPVLDFRASNTTPMHCRSLPALMIGATLFTSTHLFAQQAMPILVAHPYKEATATVASTERDAGSEHQDRSSVITSESAAPSPGPVARMVDRWKELFRSREQEVMIRGRLLMEDSLLESAMIAVELDGQVCLPYRLEHDGRFTLQLPVGHDALLRFQCSGCITKEVLVDTREATRSKQTLRMNRLVRFDVELEQDRTGTGLGYSGPVGYITFIKGTGLMKVRYAHPRLIQPSSVAMSAPDRFR